RHSGARPRGAAGARRAARRPLPPQRGGGAGARAGRGRGARPAAAAGRGPRSVRRRARRRPVGDGAMNEPIRFFLPGPVFVPEETRRTMTRPMVAHRSAEFRAVWNSISQRLPAVLRTRRQPMVATGSATLLMEASLISLTRRDVLHLTQGAFSERWLAVGRSLGRDGDELAVPWGEAIDPELLRAALRRKRYEAVTLCHNETSTGVVNDLQALSRVVHEESDALVLVDAVSSLAADRVETDAWQLDFVFA